MDGIGWKTARGCDGGACVQVGWHKATFSNSFSNCVEVGPGACGMIQVRDSKLGEDSPVLDFTRDEWAAFLAGVRAGEFDLPEAPVPDLMGGADPGTFDLMGGPDPGTFALMAAPGAGSRVKRLAGSRRLV